MAGVKVATTSKDLMVVEDHNLDKLRFTMFNSIYDEAEMRCVQCKTFVTFVTILKNNKTNFGRQASQLLVLSFGQR